MAEDVTTKKEQAVKKKDKPTVKAEAKPSTLTEDDDAVEEVIDEPLDDGAVVIDAEISDDEVAAVPKIIKKIPTYDDEHERVWVPKTKLGEKVYSGEITSLHDVIIGSAPIKEVQLVDKLLPGLAEEVLHVGRVQRVTDSGRRMRFRVTAVVGNYDGYVGIGEAKGKEAGPTIRKSIERAKLEIVEIKRGCGSWQCGCGKPHTVPFKVSGKCGSVEVTLTPAPRGVGIVSGKLAKTILSLSGITDVWVKTEGHSRTGLNFAHAVLNALENTNYVKIRDGEEQRLKIVTGACGVPTVKIEEKE